MPYRLFLLVLVCAGIASAATSSAEDEWKLRWRTCADYVAGYSFRYPYDYEIPDQYASELRRERPVSTAVAQFVGLSTIFKGTVLAQDLVDFDFAKLIAPTHNRSVGQTVYALIRPEHVQVDPAENAINRMAGHVCSQRYLGSVLRSDFSIPGANAALLCESRSLPQSAVAVNPDHICLLDS